MSGGSKRSRGVKPLELFVDKDTDPSSEAVRRSLVTDLLGLAVAGDLCMMNAAVARKLAGILFRKKLTSWTQKKENHITDFATVCLLAKIRRLRRNI